MPEPNSLECENNWQRHESGSENTHRGQITPGQMGMVRVVSGCEGDGGGGCNVYATSVRKLIQQH